MLNYFYILMAVMTVGGIASLFAVIYFKRRNEITEHYDDEEHREQELARSHALHVGT